MGIGGWIDAALDRDRVVLLEQHGNGRSTPISATTMQRFDSAQTAADYLVKFRADSKTSRHGSFEHGEIGSGVVLPHRFEIIDELGGPMA